MAFHKLIDGNARMSREREPGYIAWASPRSHPWADDRILFFEIYDSRAAFLLPVAGTRRI